MQVIASRDVLPHIRHLAGKSLPGAKSSHLAEALAAGLGHASNAALLAWLSTVPPSEPPLARLSAGDAARRLAELQGTADGAEAAFAEAAALSGAVVTGPPLSAESDRAAKLFQAGGGWNALGNQLRLAHAAWLLQWRMASSRIGVADFVENYAGAGDRDLHLRLAACAQAKRDLDREMADFLAEYLVAADAETGSGEARERLAWGDSIYWAYEPRLRAFLDMVCRTWPEGADPLAMSPGPQVLKRLGRPPVIVVGRSSRDHEFGIADTGRDDPDVGVLAGVCCMALLRAGEPKRDISAFAVLRPEGRRAIEACLSRVSFGEGAGREDGVSRLARLLLKEASAVPGLDLGSSSPVIGRSPVEGGDHDLSGEAG